MKTLLDTVRIRRQETRDFRHDPRLRTAGSRNGNGPGNGAKLSPSASGGGAPNPRPKLPSVLQVPNEWVLIVDDGFGKFLLRIENLSSQPLPLPPPNVVEAFKQAWMQADLGGFADRWALCDKNRYLATTAFAAVVRDFLPRPRSMLDIVVDKIAA